MLVPSDGSSPSWSCSSSTTRTGAGSEGAAQPDGASLDLDDYEASKQRLVEVLAEKAAIEAAQPAHPDRRYQKRGDAEVSRRTGIHRDEIRRTRKHVETADTYPAFKGKDWKRGHGGAP